MRLSTTSLRGIAFSAVAACVLGVAADTTSPTAGAAPAQCSAARLSTTASGVLGDAGGYLDGHPGANDVLTAAASQSPADAQSSVRGYFIGHPNEFLDLQNIARPLTDLSKQCDVSLSPTRLAALLEALSG